MVSWSIAAALYLLGAIEVWMVRRTHGEEFRTKITATLLWPLFVLIAFIVE